MQSESFFNHRKYFWLWANLIFVIFLCMFYFFLNPRGGHRGNTSYGYSVGIISTLGILYLMAYGIRRRSYNSYRTTLKGWLSAHVWLGISLIVIVPLHAGFDFGWNVHSLAFYIMAVVIISGIYGAVNYQVLAPKIGSHRGGGSLKDLVQQFHIYDSNISRACEGKSDSFLRLGYLSSVSLPLTFFGILFESIPTSLPDTELAEGLAKLGTDEQSSGIALIQLCEKKRVLAVQIQRETRIAAKLKLWLLLHLPLSLVLVVVVAIHIVSVLLY